VPRLVPSSLDLSLDKLLSAHRRRRPALPPFASSLVKATVSPTSLFVVLPLPPSINHQYATVNGRRVLSAMGRSFKAQVAQHILLVLARSPHRGALLHTLGTSQLALSIHFFFMSSLRRDVDGGLKIAQDALCEALDLNDNRIVEIHLHKGQDSANPRTELSLSPSSANR
jgi:crossover junction endodeoxyribonuclease RusA